MPNVLTASRRSELRAEAHKLKPVVLVGDKGLTESVVAEIDRALKAHELIKVKAGTDDREARGAWMATLCERLEAQSIQQIGKILVLYRFNPERHVEKKAPPKRTPRPKRERVPEAESRSQVRTKSGKKPALWTKKPRERETVPTGTSRRQSRTPSPRPASSPLRRRPRTSR